MCDQRSRWTVEEREHIPMNCDPPILRISHDKIFPKQPLVRENSGIRRASSGRSPSFFGLAAGLIPSAGGTGCRLRRPVWPCHTRSGASPSLEPNSSFDPLNRNPNRSSAFIPSRGTPFPIRGRLDKVGTDGVLMHVLQFFFQLAGFIDLK